MRRLKGFSLIECIISLAVLGVSSLLLVQSYSALMRATRMNNSISTSIGQQMKDAESASDAENNVKHFRSDSEFKIKLTKAGQTALSSGKPYNSDRTYSCDVDVYAIYAFGDKSKQSIAESKDGSGTDVRYVYFHTNSEGEDTP